MEKQIIDEENSDDYDEAFYLEAIRIEEEEKKRRELEEIAARSTTTTTTSTTTNQTSNTLSNNSFRATTTVTPPTPSLPPTTAMTTTTTTTTAIVKAENRNKGGGVQRVRNIYVSRDEPYSLSRPPNSLPYSSSLEPFQPSFTLSTEQIAAIDEALRQDIPSELISHRPGPGGTQLAYVESIRIMDILNEIFGWNGWSVSILNTTIDTQEKIGNNWNIGVSCTSKLTIIGACFKEDIGFGIGTGAKKAEAFEKARKEAATDALKRVARLLGRRTGGTVYDPRIVKKPFNRK